MTDLTTIIDTHLAGYGEPDATRRLERLTAVWAPDGTLVVPPIDGTGPAGIAAVVDALLGQYPGHRFERTTAVDAHHDLARYGWALVEPDGSAVLTGLDITVGADGRLTSIVGLLGDLPACGRAADPDAEEGA